MNRVRSVASVETVFVPVAVYGVGTRTARDISVERQMPIPKMLLGVMEFLSEAILTDQKSVRHRLRQPPFIGDELLAKSKYKRFLQEARGRREFRQLVVQTEHDLN